MPEGVDLDAEQAKLPSCSLERVQVLCDETEQALADNEKKLKGLAEKELRFVTCGFERGEHRYGVL